MIYDTKTAIIVRADLAQWQKVNVAAFLTGGLAGTFPEMVGEPYMDADRRVYTPLVREPIFVYGADAAELARTRQRATSRGVRFALYTAPLFKTTNDHDNRAAVAVCRTEDLDLAGLGVHADRKTVDKIVNGLKFLD